jgi:NADH:ubiquinone oxidoreductase subunit F (NADH-binding)
MKVRRPLCTDPPRAQRLFAAAGPGLRDHYARFGGVPTQAADTLISSLEAAGLTGRGGAGFPAGRKMASVTGRKPVVIGNGAEGEPLSLKDAMLMAHAPHLILDGLQLAAEAVGADKMYLYLPNDVAMNAQYALDERAAAGMYRRRVMVVEAPDTFIAGEESAVVRRIEGGRAIPRDRTAPTSRSGVRGRPTLVNNVETLAHIALIARYGHHWFRDVGDPGEPGTMLITLSGAVPRRSVVELPTGTPLAQVLRCGGVTALRDVGAVLLGGYHGGLAHTARIVSYLAEQGARQCGPCRNGLPRLAGLFDELAYGPVDDALLDELSRMLGVVDGRGACRHPDGTVRLARTALDTFASDVAHHRAGRCHAALVAAQDADRHDGLSDMGAT